MDVIIGVAIMDERDRSFKQMGLAGCGLVAFVSAMCLLLSVIYWIGQDRQTARYPGSIPISSHSNYKGLPFEYRWDDTYRTSDSFNKVYNWYSITFDLGSESRALSGCILLEGTASSPVVSRQYSVLLCNTQRGQMIYVTRSTWLNSRAAILASVRDVQSFFARPRP